MAGREVPPGVDVHTPSPARIYDFLLDGDIHFAADREVAQRLLLAFPNASDVARANRAFLKRAVRYLAGEAGIQQFIDLGSGLPTQENTHEIAQHIDPYARTVYVDYDPTVEIHTRALLREKDATNTAILQEDLRRPDKILRHHAFRGLINLDQPIAVLLIAILHFVDEDEDPAGIVARLVQAMAPGSYLVISHATGEVRPDTRESVNEIYERATSGVTLRNRAQIEALFGGLELVPPGLMTVAEWRPDTPPDAAILEAGKAGLAGVARKS